MNSRLAATSKVLKIYNRIHRTDTNRILFYNIKIHEGLQYIKEENENNLKIAVSNTHIAIGFFLMFLRKFVCVYW